MRLHFVSAVNGSAFMHELLTCVADEVTALGISATMHTGVFPEPMGDSVYVVIPHEYFVLTPGAQHPSAEQLGRTISFCVEHPGNATFETSAFWAARTGAAMDINDDSTCELQHRGVNVHRFQLGYSARLDHWHRDMAVPRPIDITYMGTTDTRRDHILSRQAEQLSHWETRLLIPPHEQMTKARPDFLMAPEKYRHLVQSKILLNLHRGGSQALEWVRILEAICNGCVVVSEFSSDFAPLTPGSHIAFSRPENIVLSAEALLRNPERLELISRDAYDLCVSELSMRPSTQLMLDIAERLISGKRLPAPAVHARRAMADLPNVPEPPQPDTNLPALGPWAKEIPENLRGAISALLCQELKDESVVLSEHRFGTSDSHALVDVIVTGTADPSAVAETLRSLRDQRWPVRVISALANIPHGIAPPRGRMRNLALRQAAADFVLIIDSGQTLFESAIARLIAALQSDPHAGAAYGIMGDSVRGTLWNSLPPESHRLRARNYLGAPILLRRQALLDLGGYTEEPALAGYEDYELWLRFCGAGHTGVLVAQIVGAGTHRADSVYPAQFAPDAAVTQLELAAPCAAPVAGKLTRE